MNRYVDLLDVHTNSEPGWAYFVANQFIVRVLDVMKSRDISQAELARKLGNTPAYVSKILRGESQNFTIETMIRIARALGCVLHVTIADETVAVRWIELPERSDSDFLGRTQPAERPLPQLATRESTSSSEPVVPRTTGSSVGYLNVANQAHA